MTASSTPDAAPPSPPSYRTIGGAAGSLRLATRKPSGGAAGTVVLLQGRGEFLEKYEPLFELIDGWGWAVLAFDFRGQGGSARLLADRARGHVEHFEDYLDDLDRVVRSAEPNLALPIVLFGHSMGGHVALRALAEARIHAAAAILVVPMVDIVVRAMPRPLARRLAAVAVRLGFSEHYAPGQGPRPAEGQAFDGNPLTSDRARFELWRALCALYPEHVLGGVTYGWVDAAFRSIAILEARGALEAVDAPVLILRAAEETIVDNAAIARAAARLPLAELVDFPAARHELLLEADATRDRALQLIRSLLDAVAPNATAAATPTTS